MNYDSWKCRHIGQLLWGRTGRLQLYMYQVTIINTMIPMISIMQRNEISE